MNSLIDLHTHSRFSDGVLSPTELVRAAAARGVEVLALTDHDTVDGLAEARDACRTAQVAFINGIELTVTWRGQEIHIVGLGLDPTCPALARHVRDLAQRRRARIAAMGEKLRRVPRLAGIDITGEVLRSAPVPTRTHLARALVAAGVSDTLQGAFDRYLGRNGRGYVAAEWPGVEDTLSVIAAAQGLGVLAHPHRYRLSGGALRNLCAEFAACGGSALEVSLPGLSPNDAARLAGLARDHGLAGSAGSDFHDPGQPWRPLGRFAKLPEGVEPLLSRLALAA